MNMGESKYLHFSKVYLGCTLSQLRKMKQRQRAEVAPKSNSELANLHETALLTPHSGKHMAMTAFPMDFQAGFITVFALIFC